MIRAMIPKTIIIDAATLTYKDFSHSETPRNNPISNLRSPRTSVFKLLSTIEQNALSKYIDGIYNVWSELHKEFGPGIIDELANRMMIEANGRDEKLLAMASKVVGIYSMFPCTPYSSVEIIITCNPFDILMKSTAQYWEDISCERYGGSFFNGVYSDINTVSLIAFLKMHNKKKPFARIMIRPCLVDPSSSESRGKKPEEIMNMRQWAYGIEKFYYSANDGHTLRRSNDVIEKRIPARIATNAIERILKEADVFSYDNSQVCITPYTYSGYSDVMGDGHTKIKYTKRLVKCEGCDEYFSAAIMKNGLCPDCQADQDQV